MTTAGTARKVSDPAYESWCTAAWSDRAAESKVQPRLLLLLLLLLLEHVLLLAAA
jgi:hypothetical protein